MNRISIGYKIVFQSIKYCKKKLCSGHLDMNIDQNKKSMLLSAVGAYRNVFSIRSTPKFNLCLFSHSQSRFQLLSARFTPDLNIRNRVTKTVTIETHSNLQL